MQRVLDSIISIVAIFLCSPFLAIVMLVLRLTGEKKVFYKQSRVGLHGHHFEILKFATMLQDSPNLPGGDITTKNDPRILPLGKILRILKINEIPQLYNVIKGEMSIVGPRPLTMNNFEMYSKQAKEVLVKTRPGITSAAALYFRNEEVLIFQTDSKSVEEIYKSEIVPYKEVLELWYCENKSLICYIKVIVATFFIVITRDTKLLRYFFDDLPKAPKYLIDRFEV